MVLLVSFLAGCQAQNDFQKKWPEYPKWGWWGHPAKDVPDPAAETPAQPDEPASDAQAQEEAPPADADASASGEQADRPATLDDHRAAVWEQVSILRDMEELSPEQQRTLIESARSNLRKWYRPMAVEPPDPDDPQWITILVWDFMPEEDFDRAAENWRQTAQKENLTFPQDVSRRELMEFIAKVTSDEMQPAPATQPVTSSAQEPEPPDAEP